MLTSNTTVASVLPTIIAEAFGALPAVSAVVLAGSREAGAMDEHSDSDLYIYAETPVPLPERAAIADRLAAPARRELDMHYWEPGDTWIHDLTGLTVDLMYRTPAWLEEQLDRVLVRHEAAIGYSTCFWHNVLHSEPLFDRDGWYARTQARAAVPYPAPLQRAIIAKNHPLLRASLSSFRHQIALALARQDWLSVQHRLTAFLVSYFDVLFALNRLPHPGEKRMLHYAETRCELLPPRLAERIQAVVSTGPTPLLLDHLDRLTDDLDALIAAHLPALAEPTAPPATRVAGWREWQPWTTQVIRPAR